MHINTAKPGVESNIRNKSYGSAFDRNEIQKSCGRLFYFIHFHFLQIIT